MTGAPVVFAELAEGDFIGDASHIFHSLLG
jgi:hypothetical protein